ncbi:MAG: hypothetical protein JWQ43_1767, partial [Glaciihabitans sp.]|nr:hypothetical protein [Glaciihabitans sp.]
MDCKTLFTPFDIDVILKLSRRASLPKTAPKSGRLPSNRHVNSPRLVDVCGQDGLDSGRLHTRSIPLRERVT